MGATTYRERHALQLHKAINEDAERDPFDADYDPTEVPAAPVNRWHESFGMATPAVLPCTRTETGLRSLAQVRAMVAQFREKQAGTAQERRALAASCCWHDTPELYRVMIARAAGLGPEVVGKLDRDLSEREKAFLRAAVRDLRARLDGLGAL